MDGGPAWFTACILSSLLHNATQEQVKILEQGSVDQTTVRNVALAGGFRANRLADLVPESWFESAYYQAYYLGVGCSDAIWAGIPVNEDAECYFGVFRHTTHAYVKAVYRKFGVGSRSALMALWLGKSA